MSETSPALACDIAALNPAERERHRLLLTRLRGALGHRAELPDGYKFRVNADAIALVELAEWMAFEHRCCPFFTLRIETAPEPEGLSVSLHGPAGIKPFIDAAFGPGL